MVSCVVCASWGCFIVNVGVRERVQFGGVRDCVFGSLYQLGLLYSQCLGSSRVAVEMARDGFLCSLCQLALYSQCWGFSRNSVVRVCDAVLCSLCQLRSLYSQ